MFSFMESDIALLMLMISFNDSAIALSLSWHILFLPSGIWPHTIGPLIHLKHTSLSITSSALVLLTTSAIRWHNVAFYLQGTIYSLSLGSTWVQPRLSWWYPICLFGCFVFWFVLLFFVLCAKCASVSQFLIKSSGFSDVY